MKQKRFSLFFSWDLPFTKILFYRKFRLCITKAQDKAHTPKVARILWLSLWESSRDSGWEGVSFHNLTLSVGFAATSPKGRGFSLIPLYHKSAEKTSPLPKIMCRGPSRTPVPTICKHPYEKERKSAFFFVQKFTVHLVICPVLW